MSDLSHTFAQSYGDLPRLPAGSDPAIALKALREHGVLVIENVLHPERLNRLRDELDPWFDQAFHGAGAFFGRSTRRFGGLFAKSRTSADLALSEEVLPLMEAVLKGPDAAAPHCDAIELNLTQAIGIEPGEGAQFLHRDEELWPARLGFEIMTNAMWTLDDFTADNGATRLIPGSHLWPRDREPLPGETVAAAAPAGSVILWTGGILHAGGANRTLQTRRGVVMSYRLGWLAPAEKLLLSTPPDIARRLPERLQRLIGYQLHRPNLGWIEGQDPIHWLNGAFETLAPTEDNLSPQHEALLADVAANPDRYLGYIL